MGARPCPWPPLAAADRASPGGVAAVCPETALLRGHGGDSHSPSRETEGEAA